MPLNALIKTLQESDELFDKEIGHVDECKLNMENSDLAYCNCLSGKAKTLHHSRSLKLLEDIRHEFIALTTKDFVILLDEAINLYRK